MPWVVPEQSRQVLGRNIHFNISGHFIIIKFDRKGVDCIILPVPPSRRCCQPDCCYTGIIKRCLLQFLEPKSHRRENLKVLTHT